MTSALTGIMASVWASPRKRPRRWMTTSVQNVNELRRAAQRSSTASAEPHTTSRSNHASAVSSHLFPNVHVGIVLSDMIVPASALGSTSVVIAVRTGTTGAVWASYRAKPHTSTSMCARSASLRRTP